MGDIDMLESVLLKEHLLVENVRPEQLGDPTPCPDYDMRTLLDHVIGWLRAFAAGANGRPFDDDPTAFSTEDFAEEFKAAANDLVTGWRLHGTERNVRFATAEMPARTVLGMTLMEYVTHGCDLAIATGQAVPFSDAELETTLARARENLTDQYRGEGKPFGPAVDVGPDAPAVDRLLGFMGRRRDAAAV